MTSERFQELLNQLLDEGLEPSEQKELQTELRAKPAARQQYWLAVMQDRMLHDLLQESRGQELAELESGQDRLAVTSPLTITKQLPGWRSASNRGRMLVGVLAASLLVMLTVWKWPQVRLEESIGKLQAVSGNVSIRQANGDEFPAAPGALLRYGQSIIVDAEDSSAEILLDDGSRLAIDAATVLTMPAARSEENRALAQGFHLKRGGMSVELHRLPSAKPLLFTTAQTSVTGAGTQFRLYTDGMESRIELNQGSAELLRQADHQEIVVSAGEYVTVAAAAAGQELIPLRAQALSRAHFYLERTLPKAGKTARFNHRGNAFATSRHRELRVWDTHTGALTHTLRNLQQPFDQVAFSSDDLELLGVNHGGDVLRWNLADNMTSEHQLPQNSIRAAHLASDGSALAQAVTSKPAQVAVWHLAAGSEKKTLHTSIPAKPWSIAISPVGPRQTVASGQWDGGINLYDAATGEVLETWRVAKSARPVSISPQSRLVAAYSQDDGLTLFQRKPSANDNAHEGQVLWGNMGARVNSLCFSQDEQLVLAGMDDGLVRGWSTRTGEQLLVLETGDRRVQELELAADGRTLLTVGHEDSVKVWHIDWPEILEVF